MHYIQKLFCLVLLVAWQPTIANSMVVSTQTKVTTNQLKFKEKVAVWFFKRKLKKVRKQFKKDLYMARDTTKCATLILDSGNKLKINLLSTTEKNVVFYRCGRTDQEITISKSSILKIILSDGLILFESKHQAVKKHQKNTKRSKPNKGIGILAILTGFFGLSILSTFPAISFLFAIITIILGILSYKRHKKSGKNIGILAIVLGILLGLFSIIAIGA